MHFLFLFHKQNLLVISEKFAFTHRELFHEWQATKTCFMCKYIYFFIWAKFLGHEWEICFKDWKMFSLTTFVLIASKTQCQKNIYEQNFATWSSTQNVFTSEEYQISRVNISFTAFSIIREHLFYQKQATLYVFFYVQNFLVIEWEKLFYWWKKLFTSKTFLF